MLYKIRIGGNFGEYMTKDNTNSIKGIFILIIFLCHICPYIKRSGYAFDMWGEQLFLNFPMIIGQLVVVMFLFFSGYGVRESIRNKGMSYVSAMPKRRILITFLNFDVAVFVFLVANLLLGLNPPIEKVLLSFVCWQEIGNSNWYIFSIIVLYIVTYLFYRFLYYRYPKINGIHFFFTIAALTIILSFIRPDWWYNTLFAYGAGVLFSEKKAVFDSFCKKNFLLVLLGLLIMSVLLYFTPYDYRSVKYNTLSVMFALLLVTLMTHVTIDNGVLRWCGEKLFPLYIYQRIPMLIIENLSGGQDFIRTFPVLYIIICLLVSVLIASLYHFWAIRKV